MILDAPVQLGLIGAGGLLLIAQACGVWKFVKISNSPSATAPEYVSTAHRASLMYAFAAQLAAALATFNALPPSVLTGAVALLLISFCMSIATYVVHGQLGDTDNQYRRPHVLGKRQLWPWLLPALTWLKAMGEIGATLLLVGGFFVRMASWP